jgi:Leucine-rich repeat (LRR) protein
MEIAALPAEEQVARVVAKLKQLDPGYDGKEDHKIDRGKVWELTLSSTTITDISPVRALRRLTSLTCGGLSQNVRSPFASLADLQGMALTYFSCNNSTVADLSPLRGMPLTGLSIAGTKVADLSPLRGMELKYLNCGGAPAVADLGPLQGMPLAKLVVGETRVADLSPLRGMRLTVLLCHHTKIKDLSSCAGMPLEELMCDFTPQRDAGVLRSLKTLKTINRLPAAEFWRQVDAGSIPSPSAGSDRKQEQ